MVRWHQCNLGRVDKKDEGAVKSVADYVLLFEACDHVMGQALSSAFRIFPIVARIALGRCGGPTLNACRAAPRRPPDSLGRDAGYEDDDSRRFLSSVP
jgi:hypothetical protein